MFEQVLDPVGGSLGLSALCAVIPLVTLFVLLGVLKMKAWQAGLIALAVSIVVAVAAYDMPIGQALLDNPRDLFNLNRVHKHRQMMAMLFARPQWDNNRRVLIDVS